MPEQAQPDPEPRVGRYPVYRQRAQQPRDRVQGAGDYGDISLEAAWAEGRELTLEQAIGLALGNRRPELPCSSFTECFCLSAFLWTLSAPPRCFIRSSSLVVMQQVAQTAASAVVAY